MLHGSVTMVNLGANAAKAGINLVDGSNVTDTPCAVAPPPLCTVIRTVIRTPNMVMYINPVIRYDGTKLPAPMATVSAS